MIVINTHKMKDKKGQLGDNTPKPELCQKYKIPSHNYTPGKSNLKNIILDAKKPTKKKQQSTNLTYPFFPEILNTIQCII